MIAIAMPGASVMFRTVDADVVATRGVLILLIVDSHIAWYQHVQVL